jgi:DNA polymerase-3 subunit beta
MTKAATLPTHKTAVSQLSASELHAALRLFSKVIDRRCTIPSLECALINAGGDHLAIYGTDLDIELSCRLPYSGPSFQALVPHHTLLNSVAAIDPQEQPEFAVTPDKFMVRAAAGSFSMSCLDVHEYHPPAATPVQGDYSIRRSDLISLIADCRPAISTEECRYYLNGLSFKHSEGVLECAATDGHRLHIKTCAIDALQPLPQVIVPTKAVRCLAALLETSDEQDVLVQVTAREVSFDVGNWLLRTRHIDGTYPDYSRIIPKEFKGSICTRVDPFAAALRTVESLHGDNWKPVGFEPGIGRLTYRSRDQVSFEGSIKVEVEGALPERLGFNAAYALALLNLRRGHMATVRFTDAASPFLIEFAGDDTFRAVLMPMRAD